MAKKLTLQVEELDTLELIFSTAFTCGVNERDSELLEAQAIKKKLYGVLLGYNTRDIEYVTDRELLLELANKLQEEAKKEEESA